MCELFAMSSRNPTGVGFSLELLARRGGADGPHGDGWGIAFFNGPDALLLREPGAASDSDLVRHIAQYGQPSELVISHIRLATFGGRALENTQPFTRELGGRAHVFAHNGDLPDILRKGPAASRRFVPIGETDSEIAFCRLLEQLADLWDTARGDDVPPLEARRDVIATFAGRLRRCGVANFLYSDSDALFVHAHRRTLPDSDVVLPGLYLLSRSCAEALPDLSDSGVTLKTVQQALTLVASVPLTDEPWEAMEAGALLVIRGGDIVQADALETV